MNKQDRVDDESYPCSQIDELFMVTVTFHCPHWKRDTLVRNGHAPMASSCIAAVRADGKAVSPCLSKSSPSGDPAWKHKNQAVCAALPEHLASLVRTCPLGSKKVAQLPPFHTTLVAPDTEDSTSTTLVVDELWSCVLKTAGKVSVWIALCRKTQQVVAYAVGDRSKKTCQQLWEAIASTYRQGHCFTGFWAAY